MVVALLIAVPIGVSATDQHVRGVLAVRYGSEVLDAREGVLLLGDEDGVSRIWTGLKPTVEHEDTLDGRVVQARLIEPDDDGVPSEWLAVVETEEGTALEGRWLYDDFELQWSVPLRPDSRLRAVGDGVAVADRGPTLVGIDVRTGREVWHRSAGAAVAPALEPGTPDRTFVRGSTPAGGPLSVSISSGDAEAGYRTVDAETQAAEDAERTSPPPTMEGGSAGTLARLRYRLGDSAYAVRIDSDRDGDDPGVAYLKQEPDVATVVARVGVVLTDAADCPAARDTGLEGRVVVLL